MGQDQITIFDTTLRDGEQAPGFSLTTAEKLRLALELDVLGVDIIEAGFPIASEADFEGVRQVALNVRRPVIAALARSRAGSGAGPNLHVDWRRHMDGSGQRR